MSEHLEQAIDYMSEDSTKYIHDHMQESLDKAYKAFPRAGLCLFLVAPYEGGMRIAHMSNMENHELASVISDWLENRKNCDERNHDN